MAGGGGLFIPTIRLVVFFVDINSECDFVNSRCIALRLVTFTIRKREGGTVSHSCELMQRSPAKSSTGQLQGGGAHWNSITQLSGEDSPCRHDSFHHSF